MLPVRLDELLLLLEQLPPPGTDWWWMRRARDGAEGWVPATCLRGARSTQEWLSPMGMQSVQPALKEQGVGGMRAVLLLTAADLRPLLGAGGLSLPAQQQARLAESVEFQKALRIRLAA